MTKYRACVVAVLDLKVMVTREDGFWFAQGLQIDYAAQGRSWLEVRKAFEDGFTATIDLHLKKYGHLEHLLSRSAPKQAWDEFADAKLQRQYSQVSLHLHEVKDLDMANIEYFEVEKEKAA